jgi:hypothetical protein
VDRKCGLGGAEFKIWIECLFSGPSTSACGLKFMFQWCRFQDLGRNSAIRAVDFMIWIELFTSSGVDFRNWIEILVSVVSIS